MTASEIAAWIGAAAWLPPILFWIYQITVKPKIALVSGPHTQIGYALFTGPSVHLNCAISASRRDAVIQKMLLRVQHEKGQSASFLWTYLNETFSQIRGVTGETAEVSKSQPAIALKVGTLVLVEKLISFNEVEFQQRQNILFSPIVELRNHLQKTQPESFRDLTIRSREFAALVDFYKKNVFWQQGKYTVTVCINVVGSKRPTLSTLEFSLSSTDIDRLSHNVLAIEQDLIGAISPPAGARIPVLYDWISVNIRSFKQ